MPSYTTADVRNLALVGSGGAGKTTLVEAMLHDAGVIGRAGRVEDGHTVCDFEDLEKEFGNSLDSAVVHLDHDGAHLNIIDTLGRLPGQGHQRPPRGGDGGDRRRRRRRDRSRDEAGDEGRRGAEHAPSDRGQQD
jgi:hypothetical protein